MSKPNGSWFTPLTGTWIVVNGWTTPSECAAAPVLGSNAITAEAIRAEGNFNQGVISSSPPMDLRRVPGRPTSPSPPAETLRLYMTFSKEWPPVHRPPGSPGRGRGTPRPYRPRVVGVRAPTPLVAEVAF